MTTWHAFPDRAAAGRALAERLAPLITGPAVVAPIPRGGVAVALPIGERLRAPMAVIYARKLSAPVAPELAFGALDEDGQMITNPETDVMAVPCASTQAAERFERLADRFVSQVVDPEFRAAGRYYHDFSLLAASRARVEARR